MNKILTEDEKVALEVARLKEEEAKEKAQVDAEAKKAIDMEALVATRVEELMAKEREKLAGESAKKLEEEKARLAEEKAKAKEDAKTAAELKAEYASIMEDLRTQREMTFENKKAELVRDFGVSPSKLADIKDLKGLLAVQELVADVREATIKKAVNEDSVKGYLKNNIDIINSLTLPSQAAKVEQQKDLDAKTNNFKSLFAKGMI